jgi:Protein of unknown function (DUF3606)
MMQAVNADDTSWVPNPQNILGEPLPEPWVRRRRSVHVLTGRKLMSDDLSKKGSQDRTRINTSEDHEVRYWSQKFGVSAEQLKAAVKKVGNSASAVERELKAA